MDVCRVSRWGFSHLRDASACRCQVRRSARTFWWKSLWLAGSSLWKVSNRAFKYEERMDSLEGVSKRVYLKKRNVYNVNFCVTSDGMLNYFISWLDDFSWRAVMVSKFYKYFDNILMFFFSHVHRMYVHIFELHSNSLFFCLFDTWQSVTNFHTMAVYVIVSLLVFQRPLTSEVRLKKISFHSLFFIS